MQSDHLRTYDLRLYAALAVRIGKGAVLPSEATKLDGYLVEEQVGFLLRRAHQRHAAIFQDGMGPLDLTPTQFTALIKVIEAGRITQNQLGRIAGMDPATIQGVVKRLIARGLLQSSDDPMDRRTLVLVATAAGQDIATRSIKLARGITESTLQPLDARERKLLLSLLRKMG